MEALIAIAVVVGIVCGGAVFLRGGLLAGCMAVLVAGCVFGYPFYHASTGLVPLTADRLLLVVLVLQYAVYRRLGLTDPKPLGKPDLMLFAFIGLLFVSTFSHDWRFQGSMPASRLLFYYLMPLAVYWVARQTPLGRRDVLLAHGCLAVFGVYLAVTAIAEAHGAWWTVFPKYIVSPRYAEFFGRGRGPLLNPVGNGLYLAVAMAASLLWWPRVNRAGKLLLAALTVLFLAGIYSTLTRSVWMGGAAVLLVLGGLSMPWRRSVALLGVATLIGTLVLVTQWHNLVEFKRDKDLSAEATADSVRLRPLLAAVAWEMFRHSPVTGCGFGQYDRAKIDIISARSVDLPLEVVRPYEQHNVFLALLAETGILGTGLFLALLLFWARDAWSLWRNQEIPLWQRQQGILFLAMTAAYLPNAMFHDLAIIPTVNMLLFLAAGITRGLAASAEPVARASSP